MIVRKERVYKKKLISLIDRFGFDLKNKEILKKYVNFVFMVISFYYNYY